MNSSIQREQLSKLSRAYRFVAQFDTNQIPQTIQRLASTHDDVVLDAPAKLEDETRALMVMADCAIFAMEPTIKSLQSTRESVQVLEYARAITGGRPREAWLVLNKAKTRTRIFREIESLAPKLGLRVAKSVIRDLQAFPEADQQGTSRHPDEFRPAHGLQSSGRCLRRFWRDSCN